jgi:hypothetical protein
MRRTAVASAILAAFLSLPLGLALGAAATAAPPPARPAAPTTDSERATAALQFLLAAQRADGSLDKSLGETADFVIGAADAGYDPSTLKACGATTGALDYLATESDKWTADAAKTGKAVLAVVAAGADPSSFATRNLLARLAALYHPATGKYGDGSTFAESFAILAVKAGGGTVPPEAIAELKSLQGTADGSWSYGATAPAAGEGDTNSTSIAVMALAAAGDHSALAAALAYFHTQQLDDGGFPYQNAVSFGFPPASDPDSDAAVIEALIAAGQDPAAVAWQKTAGNSALTHMRSTQAASGGFAYPGSGPDAFTTSQVPAALTGIPFGGAAHWTAGRSPRAIPCATATPTPTPTPTQKPTPKPTVRPTAGPTARPTAKPTPSPTDSTPTAQPAVSAAPTPTPTLKPVAADSPAAAATMDVAGVTSAPGAATPGSADSSGPSPLAYLGAAALALVVVVGGGWAVMIWPRKR